MRMMSSVHSVIGFLQQSPPLLLQYLQHLIPAKAMEPVVKDSVAEVEGSAAVVETVPIQAQCSRIGEGL